MTFSPLLVVSVLLALSVAGNGVIGSLYLDKRDDVISARADANQAKDAAKQCSDGVLSLQAAAEARAKAAEAQRDAAVARQKKAQRSASDLLARAPMVPGDACASAQAQIDDWLSTRGAK